MQVETVFSVRSENIAVEGAGQDTVKAVKQAFPPAYRNELVVVRLKGFRIDGKFVPVDLS